MVGWWECTLWIHMPLVRFLIDGFLFFLHLPSKKEETNMIIVMEKNTDRENILTVTRKLEQNGFQVHLSEGVERTIIGAIGERTQQAVDAFLLLPGVEKIVPILKPFKMASREFQEDPTLIKVGNTIIGDGSMQLIAGPCAVESREKFLEIAVMVKESGATMLRGGAFKPRTSPYSFQGLEKEGLEILAEGRELTGLPVVTEIMDPRMIDLVAEFVDVLQVGARNMQNFFLLRELGRSITYSPEKGPLGNH